jgi:hypothetical protein
MNKLILGSLIVLSTSSLAAEQTEQQCAEKVNISVSAVEQVSKQTGVEPKFKDLSVNDIRAMQKKIGSCETMREINKRTMFK